MWRDYMYTAQSIMSAQLGFVRPNKLILHKFRHECRNKATMVLAIERRNLTSKRAIVSTLWATEEMDIIAWVAAGENTPSASAYDFRPALTLGISLSFQMSLKLFRTQLGVSSSNSLLISSLDVQLAPINIESNTCIALAMSAPNSSSGGGATAKY